MSKRVSDMEQADTHWHLWVLVWGYGWAEHKVQKQWVES